MLPRESSLTAFRSSGVLVFGSRFGIYKHSAPPELKRLVARGSSVSCGYVLHFKP
jgi:hypothetical protein